MFLKSMYEVNWVEQGQIKKVYFKQMYQALKFHRAIQDALKVSPNLVQR